MDHKFAWLCSSLKTSIRDKQVVALKQKQTNKKKHSELILKALSENNQKKCFVTFLMHI